MYVEGVYDYIRETLRQIQATPAVNGPGDKRQYRNYMLVLQSWRFRLR